MERDRQRCDGSATSRIRGLPNSSLARGQKLAPVCQSMRSYVTCRKHKSDARAASLEPVAGVDRACTLRISRMSPDVVVMRDQKSPLAGRGVSLTRVHAWCLCGAQTDEHGGSIADRLRACLWNAQHRLPLRSARRVNRPAQCPDICERTHALCLVVASPTGRDGRILLEAPPVMATEPNGHRPSARHALSVFAPYSLVPLTSETPRRSMTLAFERTSFPHRRHPFVTRSRVRSFLW
jgi:hypothetical protein